MKLFAIIATLAITLALWRVWTQVHRRRFVDAFEFPEGPRKKFREARPSLAPAQEGMAFDALRQYFKVC